MTTGTSARRLSRWTTSGAGRAVVALADQGTVSLANVAVVLLVASAVPLREFGLFAVVTLVVQLTQNVAAAAVGDRMLQAPAGERSARHLAGGRALEAAVLAGLAVGALWWSVLGPSPWAAVLALGPALARVDLWRAWSISTGHPGGALAVDVSLAVVVLGAVVAWARVGAPEAAAGAAALWAVAATVAVAVLAVVTRGGAGDRATAARLRDAVSLRYGLEMAAVSGSGQIAQLAVTAELGLAFSGTLRAAQVPFGIVVVLVLAARTLIIPVMQGAPEAAARRVARFAAAGAVLAAVVFTGVTLVASEVPRLRFVVGGLQLDPWFVVVLGGSYAAVAAGMVHTYFLRARHRDREVSVGRATMLGVLAVGTAAAVVTSSPWIFLAALGLSWVAGSVAMAATPASGGAADLSDEDVSISEMPGRVG